MNTMMVLFGVCLFFSVVCIWVAVVNRRTRSHLPKAVRIPLEKSVSRHGVPASARPHQRSVRSSLLILVACLCTFFSVQAQEVIHALSGTVTAVSPSAKTITMKLEDGSTRVFKQMPTSRPALAFDKTLQAQSHPANELKAAGAHVILFYYGYDDSSTAVAFKDIGSDVAKPITGEIADFDRQQHVLTVKEKPQAQKLIVNEQTVVDTANGAVDGLSYHPSKGRTVLIVASNGEGQRPALFVSPFE